MPKTEQEKRENKIVALEWKLKECTYHGKYRKAGKGVAVFAQRLARIKTADEEGFVKCVTCGKFRHYKDRMNGGHFIDAKHYNTIIDPINIWPQCAYCNDHLKGNLTPYRSFLGFHIGLEEVRRLDELEKAPHVRPSTRQLAEIKYDIMQEIKRHEKRIKHYEPPEEPSMWLGDYLERGNPEF